MNWLSVTISAAPSVSAPRLLLPENPFQIASLCEHQQTSYLVSITQYDDEYDQWLSRVWHTQDILNRGLLCSLYQCYIPFIKRVA